MVERSSVEEWRDDDTAIDGLEDDLDERSRGRESTRRDPLRKGNEASRSRSVLITV